MELFGRLYDTEQAVRIEISDRRVARVVPLETDAGPSDRTDRWPWIAPALLDVQVNGYGGQEFSSATLTEEKVGTIIRAFEPFGVARICPTVTTEGFTVLQHALRTIASVCATSPHWAWRMPGIHLEGPYITSDDGARGAHPKIHCRPPAWDEFQRLQEAAGGRIRILTMSPEFDDSPRFIEQVAATGVVVAIGHTSARPDQIRAAVDAGARMSTHLGNGSHPTLHRFRNYLWPQLADDRLLASLIADGHHLSPDMVKVFVRAKTAQRCILVSDISGQAGQPPGRYTSPFCDVEILPDGNLLVAGQRELMGGASSPMSVGVANVMRFAGVGLKTAVDMAAGHPARLLGLEPVSIAPGGPADLFQFDLPPETDETIASGLRVRCTLVNGEVVWGNPWQPSATGSSGSLTPT
jgi:N-acetylglucosamine-6-phosphate deacetylase